MCAHTEKYSIGKGNLSPPSYPTHPTDKGTAKAPGLMKLKIPIALLWQS